MLSFCHISYGPTGQLRQFANVPMRIRVCLSTVAASVRFGSVAAPEPDSSSTAGIGRLADIPQAKQNPHIGGALCQRSVVVVAYRPVSGIVLEVTRQKDSRLLART